MRSVSVSREVPASTSSVWGVLADFPNIADWNGGVKTSYTTGDQIDGVGATRHCDLSPTGSLEETIREWHPREKLVVSIDSATKLPIEKGLATFTLAEGDQPGSTTVGLLYEFDTKWGIAGRLMGGVMERQLTKGFAGFLADLEAAATATS